MMLAAAQSRRQGVLGCILLLILDPLIEELEGGQGSFWSPRLSWKLQRRREVGTLVSDQSRDSGPHLMRVRWR